MRNYVYDKAGGKGSILNTKVTTKGLVKTIGGAIIGTAIVANLVGCGALKNYGKLTPDGIYNTDQGIEKKVDLNYFEAGTSKDSPDAIMGLVKSEKLSDDSSWHSLGSYNKTFEESIKDLSDKTSETQESIRKYDLIGPEGRDVGDLYFNGINSGILIKRKKDGTFYISTPGINVSGGGGSSGSSGGGGSGGGGSGGGSGGGQ